MFQLFFDAPYRADEEWITHNWEIQLRCSFQTYGTILPTRSLLSIHVNISLTQFAAQMQLVQKFIHFSNSRLESHL